MYQASLSSSSNVIYTYPGPNSSFAVCTPDMEVDEISIYLARLVQAVLVQGCASVSERQIGGPVSRFTLKRSR